MNLFNKLLIISILLITVKTKGQDFIIGESATLEISPSAKLVFENGMNLVNNSSNANLGGEFVFSGNLPQMISGSKPLSIGVLTLENGAFVDVKNAVTVNSAINLNDGIINLTSYDLLLASGADLNGTFSEASMIVAEGTGKFKRGVSSNGEYFFPVGDTSNVHEYTPATITFNSGTYNNAIVGINLKNKKHPANSSTMDYLNRYWTVSQEGISDFDCNVEFNYTNDDVVGNESNMYGGKWNGEYWTALNPVSLTSITGKVQSFSDFTGGELSVLSVDDQNEVTVEVLVDGKNIKMISDSNFPVKRIELVNKLGQRVYSVVPSNALYSEFTVNEKADYYMLRLTSDEKAITKKIYIW